MNSALKKHGITLAITAALSGPALAQEAPSASPQQPNVLFIFVDDIGYADMGFQNQSQATVL